MKKRTLRYFIVRLIEGQTSDLETFVCAVVIIALSAALIEVGNLLANLSHLKN